MSNNQKKNNIKEAVGIFDNNDKLQEAIDELSISGFERYEISVIGSESAMQQKFNVSYKDPKYLVDNPQTPRSINVSSEEVGVAEGAVISGGILAGVVAALIAAGGVAVPSTIPAAIIGATAGTALGGVMAQLIGNSHAKKLQQQIDAGGLVLWVRTHTLEKEKLASDILTKHEAKDVHIHSIKMA